MVSAFAEAGVSCFLCCIGSSNRRYFEEEYLPEVLSSTIATIIPQILGVNIANKKIDAETKVNQSCDQAVYFFSTLHKLRTQSDEKRSRNPITKIRQRISSQSSIGSGSRGSHRRGSSVTSFNMKRINSSGSFGSDRNSILTRGDAEDDRTVDTSSRSLSPGSKRTVVTAKSTKSAKSTKTESSKASKTSKSSKTAKTSAAF